MTERKSASLARIIRAWSFVLPSSFGFRAFAPALAVTIGPVQPASHVAPTRVRYFTLCLCIAMAVLLYLDRYALSSVTGTLLVELNVNKERLGSTVFFPFFFAYALLQIPAGWLSDTFGARMLALYVATWSLATISMGLVNGLAVLFLVRFVLGLAQAGAIPPRPASSSAVPLRLSRTGQQLGLHGGAGRWPAGIRGHSLPHAARRTLAWIGDGPLAPCFCTVWSTGTGLGGPLCLAVSRLASGPSLVNEQEIELISPASDSPRTGRSPAVHSAAAGNLCKQTSWLDVRDQFLRQRRLGLSRLLAAFVPHGNLRPLSRGQHWRLAGRLQPDDGTDWTGRHDRQHFVGLATDRLVVRLGPLWRRRLPGLASGVVVTAIYLLAPHLPNVWWFVAAMAGISFSIDFSLGAIWASYQDIGGRHVASFLGCGNMFGSFGAALFTGRAAASRTAISGAACSFSPPPQ